MIEKNPSPSGSIDNEYHHPQLWEVANRIVTIANTVNEQHQQKITTPQDLLTELTEKLDQILNIYKEIRPQHQDLAESSLGRMAKTIAFSLTARRRQQDRDDTVDAQSMALQKSVFKIKELLKKMDPSYEAGQHQLLILINQLGEHPLLVPVFSWRKERRGREEAIFDQLENASPQEVTAAVGSLLGKIKQDKIHADLTDSFSESNPRFDDISYIYDHISEINPESDHAIKALMILAEALEYEENRNENYISLFGRNHNSSYLWALSRRRLRNN